MRNNILIGRNAGLYMTSGSYKLIIKNSRVDIDETMTKTDHYDEDFEFDAEKRMIGRLFS